MSTLEQLSAELVDAIKNPPYEVGKAYLFRCVTYHYIGTVVHIGPLEVVLRDSVWVADTGKFQPALETGALADWMHYPDDAPVILGRLSIVDATPWRHTLPPRRTS